MSSAAELGISEQDFQEAMNLEKIYSLLNKSSGRCSKCTNVSDDLFFACAVSNQASVYRLIIPINHSSCVYQSPTHVDCSTYQWLCPSHAVGKGNCKKIGDERFSTFEVEKLEKKFGG